MVDRPSLKALFLTREYPPDVYGGAGVHVDYLSRELAKLIPVEVRTFEDHDARAGHLRVRGHRFAAAAPGDAPAPFLAALQALRVCLSFAAEPIDADVVHCHTWYAQFGGVLARLLYGIPLVVTAHSIEPLRPWKRDQLGRGADLSAWIEKEAIEAADAVVAVSTEMRADILRHFAVSPDRVVVIHNGIDTGEYRPVPGRGRLTGYGIDPDRPTVLFVGRISRQKGLLYLVNAIPHLEPGTQVVLCAGAPDTPEIAREVETAVRRAQAARPHVVWIREMVDRATAIELYSQAAVFCCPSIYEPFGIINLEAMACQTPVVASAVGGIPEIVVHGETGYLVPVARQAEAPFEPLDPDRFARDLARAINALLADRDLRAAMGLRARQRAEARFSWRAIAGEVLALYRALVERRPLGPAAAAGARRDEEAKATA
jgi:glycogen synthase